MQQSHAKFDLYLPIDFKPRNVGYAFINYPPRVHPRLLRGFNDRWAPSTPTRCARSVRAHRNGVITTSPARPRPRGRVGRPLAFASDGGPPNSSCAAPQPWHDLGVGRACRRPPPPRKGCSLFLCAQDLRFLLHDDPCAELLVRLDETIPAPPLYGSDPRSPTPHSPLPALPSPHSPRLLSPIPADSHGRPSLCVAPVFPNVCAVSTV